MRTAALLVLLAAPVSGRPPQAVELGVNASLGGRLPFPPDNPWNMDVSAWPVDPDSDRWIASIGADEPLHPDFGSSLHGEPFGIPYVVVAGSTPRVPVRFEEADESDREDYPIPPDAPVEGGDSARGDRHVIVLDRDHWRLYELYAARRAGGRWTAASGAIFDLASNALRPAGWTSADAAGLPVFPGLVRYDEVVEQKRVAHALRFTAMRTRRAYVFPARHFASKNGDEALPPMGARARLKRSVDLSAFPESARVLLVALQTHGMFLADNGGNWFVSGTADPRWNDGEMATLKRLRGRDFEFVQAGPLTAR